MPTPNDHVDLISTIFDNPFVKGALAAVSALAAIVKYIKGAGDRYRRAATIATRYNLKGFSFWIVDILPHILHRVVAFSVLIAAFVETAVLIDQYSWGGAFLKAFPAWAQDIANFLSTYFVALFLVALVFYLAFELRVIERSLAWLVGLIPRLRNSLEWANAKWQIGGDTIDVPLLASSEPDLEKWTNTLIDELTHSQRSDGLAIRPTNLSDDSAANVLYFGHVVEEYCSEKLQLFFRWTVFYEALAQVARTNAAPFSPDGVRAYAAHGAFFAILLSANHYLPPDGQIPNEAGLEAAVDDAFNTLRSHWDGDARNSANGFAGTDYSRVLRNSANFLRIEGMRRQFAKLFILWTIKPGATHPDVFRIPFSTGIFIKYIDAGIIRTEGQRFDSTSELVSICFEAVQRKIVKRVFLLLTQTKDAARVAWRQTECRDIESRKLNWTWWVYYRVDVQTYVDSRGYKSDSWKRSDKEIVSEKKA